MPDRMSKIKSGRMSDKMSECIYICTLHTDIYVYYIYLLSIYNYYIIHIYRGTVGIAWSKVIHTCPTRTGTPHQKNITDLITTWEDPATIVQLSVFCMKRNITGEKTEKKKKQLGNTNTWRQIQEQKALPRKKTKKNMSRWQECDDWKNTGLPPSICWEMCIFPLVHTLHLSVCVHICSHSLHLSLPRLYIASLFISHHCW